MATAQRPSTALTVSRHDAQLELLKKAEVAPFTSDHARELLTPIIKPLGITFEQVVSELYFVVKKNPAIAKCTPESQLEAAARALSWGLTLGEKAFIVPFKNVATAVRSYQGDIELIVNAGGAKAIDAHAVWDDDVFDYGLGTNPFITHKHSLKARAGHKIIAGYAVATIGANLPPKIVVMGIDEIESVRKRLSKSWYRDKNNNVIPIESIAWYVEKTPVHRITKQLPTSPRLALVMKQLDEEIVTDAEIEDAPAARGGEEPGAGVGAPASVTGDSWDAPIAAEEGVSAEPADLVDDAYKFKLPGEPGSWNGHAGEAIGAYRRPHLVKIREWCVKQLEHADMEADDPAADPIVVALLRNIDIILADRDAHPEKEPTPKTAGGETLEAKLKESVAATAKPTPAKAPAAKPAGSGGPVTMPKGGRVEDAIAPAGAKPSAPTAPVPTFGGLVKQIGKLLDSAERNAEEKADIRKRMDDATSIGDLQRIVADLSLPV